MLPNIFHIPKFVQKYTPFPCKIHNLPYSLFKATTATIAWYYRKGGDNTNCGEPNNTSQPAGRSRGKEFPKVAQEKEGRAVMEKEKFSPTYNGAGFRGSDTAQEKYTKKASWEESDLRSFLLSEKIRRMGIFLSTVKILVQSRFFTHRPFFISHLITTRCFARCPTCLWRGDSPEEEDTAKVVDFYRRARKLGFVSTTFWGGEPLLRRDIIDILKNCWNFGIFTGLITNGYFLPRFAPQLARFLAYLIVSVDAPGQENDRLRGVEGLYDLIVSGIQQIKKENPRLKVFINSVISQLNFGHVEALIGIAETFKMGITFEAVKQGEVEFPRPEGKTVVSLRLSLEKEKEIFGFIQRLKEKHRSINPRL